MNSETIAIAAATLIGPIAAVQIQAWLDRRRRLVDRQTTVFRTLMTHRLALSVDNVQAFNAVPVEFYGQNQIVAAWRAYLAHLGIPAGNPANPAWVATRVDLFFDLLQKMAIHLGYEFNFVELKNDFYSPQGHAEVESDQETIRRGLASVFAGHAAVPMDVRSFPADTELNTLLKDWLKSQTGTKVAIPIAPAGPPAGIT